ncbi:hypothetical protein ABK040_014065 [Willaertia magna]
MSTNQNASLVSSTPLQAEGKYICIFGGSAPQPGDDLYELSVELGRKLAENGFGIVNGGYGGTMEGSSKGASEIGGVEIKGVISSDVFWKRKEQGNKYLTSVQDTTNLTNRLQGLIDNAKHFVVLPGNLGTGLELMLVWNLFYIQKLFFPESKIKKVYIFKDPWERIVNFIKDELKVSQNIYESFVFVSEVDEIIEHLKKEEI